MSQYATKDECHMAAGKLLGLASTADNIARYTFIELMGAESSKASAVFHTFTSLQPRIDMMNRVAKAFGDPEIAELTKAICRKWQKVHNQRKLVAHALLALSPGVPPKESSWVYIQPKSGEVKKATKKYLKSLVDQAHSALMEMSKHHFDFFQRIDGLNKSTP